MFRLILASMISINAINQQCSISVNSWSRFTALFVGRSLFVALLLLFFSTFCFGNSPGKNGTRTITAANTIVNQSSTLASGVAVGAGTITVANIANLSSAEVVGGGALAVGDVILIYQARGASVINTNTHTYGEITAYGNAGNYEFQSVAAVSGNNIGLAPLQSGTSCTAGALKRNYSSGAQVIRVPQYANLTINAAASVAAAAWNGSVGGVVAMRVQNSLVVNGSITTSGLGFRGGINDPNDRAVGSVISFASNANPAGGAKGEGIASGAGGTFGGVALPYSSPGFNFDIAAPANGGGGGGSHNAGGGGGANAASSLTPYCSVGTATYSVAISTAINWCGQGVMPSTVTGATAWTLDPGYRASGNALTNQVGGGRGGYAWSNTNQNALTVGPGLAAWGGDNRRALGGWGGRPLAQDLANRLFFGGGGGAGAASTTVGGDGGFGGGIVLIEAGSISGSGALLANGNAGEDSGIVGVFSDGAGGGGGGGSIVLRANSGSFNSYQASGGKGGNLINTAVATEGTGGGGGGGVVAIGSLVGSQMANAGTGGTGVSSGITEFPRNGSTDGSAGLTGESAPELIFPLIQCAALSISKTNFGSTLIAGATTTYTVVIANAGPAAAHGSILRDPEVAGLTCSSISCASAAGTTCAASVPPASLNIASLQEGGIPITSFPANSTLSFALTCAVTATGL